MDAPLRLAFLGTWDLGFSSFQALLQLPPEVARVAMVWTDDAERNLVQQQAREWSLPVHLTSSMRNGSEGARAFREAAVDLAIMCNFKHILGTEALQATRLGVVNVHPSLLPRHRGPAPLKWAIRMGDRQSGATAILTDRGVDTGNILTRVVVPMDDADDHISLARRLLPALAQATQEVVYLALRGPLTGEPQDTAQATYARHMTEAELQLHWTETAAALWLRVRMANPPGAWFLHHGTCLRVAQAGVVPGNPQVAAGTVLLCGDTPIVQCGEEALQITAWVDGQRLREGDVLQ